MSARTINNDIIAREHELLSLFKSQEIIQSANRLCDFINDFSTSKEDLKDCIVFCNRASNIIRHDKRKKFKDLDDYQDAVTQLLYDMIDHLDTVMNGLNQLEEVA